MTKRIFYVVYFDDPRLQASLDTIRFIANPNEKTPAHITLRGPYSQLYNVRGLERKIHGAEVMADGAEGFFRKGQNTVFIRCFSEKFQEVWKKSDFPFNPHITIYDGSSRRFAKMLLDRLVQFPIKFRFLVGKLSPLESHKGQYSTLLRQSFNEKFTRTIVGELLTVSEVDSLSSERRASLVELFARKLPGFSSPPMDVSTPSETSYEKLIPSA